MLLPLFLITVAGIFLSANAQKQKSFQTNGRMINVDSFNREIKKMMKEVGVPALSLAVIENNKVVFHNTYGVKKKGDKKMADNRTVFDAASLSKSYLVFAVYKLVDQGKLDLDKPLYQYLKYDRLEYDPRYKLITARMVLSHSSGIENWQSQNDPLKLEIISDPGTKLVYSGEGYNYLAKVVESILHQPYEIYIRDLVLNVLQLNNSYLKFTKHKHRLFHKESPWNYAVGHGVDSKPIVKKNYAVSPASGNHITAEDYAKLIIGTFDTTHLSVARIKDLEQPIARVNNSSTFYGPGFEVGDIDGDLVIEHGGDNDGFKNQMFYSIAKKRGYVFLSNSDRGRLMVRKLCEMTVQMNIEPYLNAEFYLTDMYPSNASDLLRIYDEEGVEAMYAALDKLKKNGTVGATTLDIVSFYLKWYYGGDNRVTQKLLEENIALYPDSSLSYVLLGRHLRDIGRPDSALLNLRKAQEMHFSAWSIDGDITECETKLVDFNRRKSLMVRINEKEQTTVPADNYNLMSGVVPIASTDEGGGRCLAYIEAGDWMEYRIDVPDSGNYSMTLRVASLPGGGQVELRIGDTLLTTMNIETTKGWQNWVSKTTAIRLPAGSHTLRLYARGGGFKLNWLKFAKQSI